MGEAHNLTRQNWEFTVSLCWFRLVWAMACGAIIFPGGTLASPWTSLKATPSSLRTGRCTLRRAGWRISRRLMRSSQNRLTSCRLGEQQMFVFSCEFSFFRDLFSLSWLYILWEKYFQMHFTFLQSLIPTGVFTKQDRHLWCQCMARFILATQPYTQWIGRDKPQC